MWKICVSDEETFLNIEKIFPTQQRDVGEIVRSLQVNTSVRRIVIFGSSVTSACNPWSDIDVYVELDEEQHVRVPQLEVPTDVWTNFDVDDRLMAEIEEKGVAVYER